jgi:hypothetical protein
MIERPRDEWILLPEGTAPALIDRETFEEIQKQAARKKAESIRNNRHPDELGLLRAGHIFCGICGRKMSVWYPRGKALLKNSKPGYMCRRKAGGDTGKELNHFVQTHMPQVDRLAWEKVIDVLRHPEWVRARVYELREKNKQLIDKEDINGIITHINTSIKNLCRLASESTSDDTMAEITLRLKDLEKKKREALALLSIHKDDEREKQEIEMEIQKFEAWAEKHLSQLSDSSQEVSYEEKRLAVRMLGLRVTVYPTQGDYPCRFQFDVTMPDIVKKIHSSTIEGWIVDPALYQPLP